MSGRTPFTAVQISTESHKVLKKMSQEEGRSMRWILETAIKRAEEERHNTVKLK